MTPLPCTMWKNSPNTAPSSRRSTSSRQVDGSQGFGFCRHLRRLLLTTVQIWCREGIAYPFLPCMPAHAVVADGCARLLVRRKLSMSYLTPFRNFVHPVIQQAASPRYFLIRPQLVSRL